MIEEIYDSRKGMTPWKYSGKRLINEKLLDNDKEYDRGGGRKR